MLQSKGHRGARETSPRAYDTISRTVLHSPILILVSSGSVAVHPDSSVQLLAEEATLVDNLDAKVKDGRSLADRWW